MIGCGRYCHGGWWDGHLHIRKGRGVLPGAPDPYPFPDTIETPFQTKVRLTYTPCLQTMYDHLFLQLTLQGFTCISSVFKMQEPHNIKFIYNVLIWLR